MASGSGSRILAVALFVGAAVISFQAWQNGKITPEVQAAAKQHACDLDSSCIVLDDDPRIGEANAFQHRYELRTTHGVMTVTCKRSLIFFGPWQCRPQAGSMISDPF
ncbi:hypothetical protein G6O69_06410 [Pseudenhygromyxa sp. WMMC2535]|uniref:hypothetical protein n=1 Tax=Pseudenhygromyxa sp. WMMC2535 TaxID=2712867 RepID=UPI0015533FBD|nr:hypothetical protein [Pseudenhygromyxa sp. WMMC2535]NVB37457.1 hypothetical protein [Pseudenhygromyxa sp. WMMC2535]